jgi:hypothetical protein
VTFLEVQKWITRLHRVVASCYTDPKTNFEWDMHLISNNSYKSGMNAANAPVGVAERLLFVQQPRFIWRAVLSVAGHKKLELLADATDMERSFQVYASIWHDEGLRNVLRQHARSIDTSKVLLGVLKEPLYEFVRSSTASPVYMSDKYTRSHGVT